MYPYLMPSILSHEDLLEALVLGRHDDGVYVGYVKRSISTGFGINLYNIGKERLKLVDILSARVGIPGEGQDLNPKLELLGENAIQLVLEIINNDQSRKLALVDHPIQKNVNVLEVVVLSVPFAFLHGLRVTLVTHLLTLWIPNAW